MAKFSGVVGYGVPTRTAPGVTKDVIVERKAYGDVLRNTRRLDESSETVNKDISTTNTISIVADAYARDHFFAIRYVSWMGVLWTVTSVEVNHPRLLLRLGGQYNGPTPKPAPVAP